MGRLLNRQRSGIAKAVPAWRQCTQPDQNAWLAGVDGCAGGWIAAFVRPQGGEARVRIVPRFADVLAAPEQPAVIAVDMPIGLPERVGVGGRAAENCVRPLLGARQSSVFSVPSRAAIYAADYGEACRIAQATSDPPRKVSKQLFNIAAKIREVDEALRDELGRCRPGVRGASRAGVLAAQRRPRADRTEEGQEPAL